ncbi:MAG: hypothetical protein IID30_06930 [Planctomycetes bacterium]|nr:hypothetical protein [Planctomycetota bacterium]MCH7602697.1 hypothetical protein [Planctomycetota bacterium]
MNITQTRCALICPIVLVFVLTGCLERKEHIVVRPDGSVKITVNHTSESWDDMYLGDAWPRLEGGWLAVTSSQVDNEGKETFYLKAEATFPPDVELPSDYEIPQDHFPATSTVFPTELTIEERRDGTYYHFKRSYLARPWAYVAQPREMVEDEIKGMDDREIDELSPTERRKIITTFAKIEVIKLEAFARAAFDDVAPHAPQDIWLDLHAALLSLVELLDYDRIIELMGKAGEPADEEALDEEAKKFEIGAMEEIDNSLRRTGYLTGSEIREFFQRLDWHRTFYERTEDTSDDTFTISVTMPGEIVAHNGDNMSGHQVTWEFNGEMFRDRNYDLMVTSRVSGR